MANNNIENIAVGKPKIGGAIYVAPAETATLPTDAKTKLHGDYKCLGYVSTDGLVNDNSTSSDQVKAWGGDTVLTISKDKKDEFKLSLLETLDVEVLKVVFGSENVTGTLEGGITIRCNNVERDEFSWVFEIMMKSDVMKRIVIEKGAVTDVAEVKYKDSEAVSYDITVMAKPGSSKFGYDTHKEYIAKIEA